MGPDSIYDVAVIGAGGAGQMAMLRSVLNHLKTVVYLGDPQTTRKSRATWVSEVENIPGMFDKKRPITATSREVMQFIDKREDLKPYLASFRTAATAVKKEGDFFVIQSHIEDIRARYVVLCAGTMDVQPVIGGSIEPIFPYANREDVLYCIRCDGHKVVGHSCAVIGKPASAAWIAVMLKERYDLADLHVLTHGQPFDVSQELRDLVDRYQIKVSEEEITAVTGNPKEGLEGFELGDKKIAVTKAFVSLGSIVYNELAKKLGVELNDRDHVITNEKGETNVPGFYAAGDLVAGKKKQVYTAWDMAVDAVDDIDLKIRLLKRSNQYTSV